MKITDIKFGVLVEHEEYGYGMIKGITNNCDLENHRVRSDKDRMNIVVEWQSGLTTNIHPANVELVKWIQLKSVLYARTLT